MNKVIIVFITFLITGLISAEDTARPTAPTSPTEPERPVVSGAVENIENPRFPVIPSFPERDNQSNGSVYEIEKYYLNISGAYTNGNTRNNAANTINNAQYILYSNRTALLKLFFIDGSEYTYHLRNPRAKIEINAGVFRETFDALVQVGREFLLEQYLGELSYNSNTVTSFNLIGNNRVVVQLVFSKKI